MSINVLYRTPGHAAANLVNASAVDGIIYGMDVKTGKILSQAHYVTGTRTVFVIWFRSKRLWKCWNFLEGVGISENELDLFGKSSTSLNDDSDVLTLFSVT